jgi:hypothetical protein
MRINEQSSGLLIRGFGVQVPGGASVVPSPFQRHQVLWELDQRPALLAGEGAHGSPRVNALIQALADAGVPGIVAPDCPSCGRTVPLRYRLGEVRCCRRCYDRDRVGTCSRCGQASDIASRTPAGDPVCSGCFRRDPANHGRCSNCGRTALTVRRDDGTAWCRRCYRVPFATCSLCGRDKPCYLAASFRSCTACGTTGHLYHHGLCIRCACLEHLLSLLSHDQGGMHPHAEAIYHVLAASDPAPLMQWLTTSSAAGVLADISRARRPPGHADLDRFHPGKATRHLRKILVAGGILPTRDERLAELERWVTQKTGQIGDPAERRAVRGFATWHHLRRLRGESARHHITAEQADYVHNEVRAAVTLITWLRDHGTSLASCTQRDIDDWLATGPGTCYHARSFVTWASSRSHAGDVEIPRPARNETLAQLEEDRRWELVRPDQARCRESGPP